MNRFVLRARGAWSAAMSSLLVAGALLAGGPAGASGPAVCHEVASGLRLPVGLVASPRGRMLVAESGTGEPSSGRISIVARDGTRRTLIDGLPSARADVGDPSGPTGMVLRGRTLYVLIGTGDVGVLPTDAAGQPIRGSTVLNPNGPSSPLFSSLLKVEFDPFFELGGSFQLAPGDDQRLAAGETVELHDGAHRAAVSLVADLPNALAAPTPVVPDNVKLSNPYQMAIVGDRAYVTDGGRNLVWEVDLASGASAPLVSFPPIANPLFGTVGPPMMDAVPTGIAADRDGLLVALLRGAPFPPGASTIQRVVRTTGGDTTAIAGLKMAIGVLPVAGRSGQGLLVLQHASQGLFFGGPGRVLFYADPAAAPEVVADCLALPSAMALDRSTGVLYVVEVGGRLVALAR